VVTGQGPAPVWPWLSRTLRWIGIVLLVVVAVVAFARRSSSRDVPTSRSTAWPARRAAAAEPLYRAEDGHWQFKYLPAFAFAVAPLAQLPPVAARAAWFFLSVALVVLLVNRSFSLLPDRRRNAAFLICITVLAMGKFYVRELVSVRATFSSRCSSWRRRLLVPWAGGGGRALLAAATIVKPYAIVFCRIWSRAGSGAAWRASVSSCWPR